MSRVRDVDVEEIISLLNARSTREPNSAAAAAFAQPSVSATAQDFFSHAFWSGEDEEEEEEEEEKDKEREEDSDSLSYDPASSSAASDSEGACCSDSSCLSVASAPVAGAAAGGSRQKTKKKRKKTRRSKGKRKFRGVRSRVMDWVKQTKSNARNGNAASSAGTCSNPKSRASSRSTSRNSFRLSKDCLDLRERDRSRTSSRNRRLKPPWRPSSSSSASVGSVGSAPATLFNCRSTGAVRGSRTDVDSDFSGDENGQWQRQHNEEKVKRKKLRISQQYRAVVNRLREAVESYRLRNAGLRKSLSAASDVLVLRDDQIAALSRQVQAQRAALAAHGAQQDLHSKKVSVESRVERYRRLVSDGRARIKDLTSQLEQASAQNAEFQQRLQRSLGLNVWVKQRLEDTEAEAIAAKANVTRLQEENEELRTQIQQYQLATRSRRTRAHPQATVQGAHGAISSTLGKSRPRKQRIAKSSRFHGKEATHTSGRQGVLRESTLLKPTASAQSRATAGRAHVTTFPERPRSAVAGQATFSDISNSSSRQGQRSTHLTSKAHRPPAKPQPAQFVAKPTLANVERRLHSASLEAPGGLALETKSGPRSIATSKRGQSQPGDGTTAENPPPSAEAGAVGDAERQENCADERHQEGCVESSFDESASRIAGGENEPNHLWHALSGNHSGSDFEDLEDDVNQKVEPASTRVVEKRPQPPDRKVLAAPKLANATEDARKRFERLQSMYQRVYRTPLN